MDAKETTTTELYPESNPHFSQDWKKSMSTVLRIMKTEFHKKKKKGKKGKRREESTIY